MRDPYAVLGVARDASEGDIKKAYRRLAKKLHPDLSPGNRSAEQQFKEVTAAYDLLSDPAKRARFDRGEIDPAGAERGFNFRDQGARAYRRAADANFSFDEIIAELLGRNRRGRPEPEAESTAPEPGAAQKLRVSFLEAALGAKHRVTLADGRAVDVAVPAGVDSGQTLRLRATARRGAATGDIHLEIEVDPHPLFQRKGRDIHIELPVSLTEAVLGASVTVPTIHGSVTLKVPPGSNSGSTFRLKGKGILAEGKIGDHYVKLRVVLPDPPDPELVAFLQRWGAKRGYDVRDKS
jgi:DnaJ-class molecular chaperone